MLMYLCKKCFRAIESDKPCKWCAKEQKKAEALLTKDLHRRKIKNKNI